MDSLRNFLLAFLFFTMIITPTTPQPQPCRSHTFPNHVTFAACNDLPSLDFSIHWNYHSSSNTISLAFKKTNAKESNWVSWAINPTLKGMVGSQAFVAFQRSDGTLAAYTSPITSYGTRLQEGNLSFPVQSVSGSYSNGEMIIFATFQLPRNGTLVNHLWQEGSVSDDTPRMHALSGPNIRSFGSLDFLSGKISESNDGDLDNQRILLRKVHGILNGIGWGILMPIGAMMARYLKAFDGAGSAWFHLHRACQILAYFTGVVGFAIGIYMGSQSPIHEYIGIALFCLATAQILAAMFFRPHKEHKTRIFWNIFHYIVGYGIIALAIVNMFRGFAISNSYKKWKLTYFGIIVSLGCIALILEIVTWFLVCKKKKKKEEEEDEQADESSQNCEEQEGMSHGQEKP